MERNYTLVLLKVRSYYYLAACLVVGLPIGKEGCRSGEHFREKVVRKEEGSHARTDRHASQISEGTASNAAKDVIGEVLWWDGLFARTLQDIDLVVEIVVKITGHGGWVHGTHIDS